MKPPQTWMTFLRNHVGEILLFTRLQEGWALHSLQSASTLQNNGRQFRFSIETGDGGSTLQLVFQGKAIWLFMVERLRQRHWVLGYCSF